MEMRDLPRMLLMKFLVQFVDLYHCLSECLFACFGQLVDPAPAAANVSQLGDQKSIAFHTVQERIDGSGSNAVAVVLQFLHHGQTKYRFMSRMNEHMDANQSRKEFPVMC
jgi:hypothetical protein